MYWVISYQWRVTHGTTFHNSMDLHKGRLADWVLMAKEQPESWVLLGATEISEEEYGDLLGEI